MGDATDVALADTVEGATIGFTVAAGVGVDVDSGFTVGEPAVFEAGDGGA